ncbi:MAG: ATP-binding protein [Clostridiales bacterium]|jgi:DNA replication protein DnaC|nr:ATP-binding protein [Eubacteriales bacterium]MDH7566280.1 ATP-binding protein [Clostridiales bacterium]
MNRNIQAIIKREYEKRQKSAYDRLLEKEAEVYSKIPRLRDIDNEIKTCGIRYNKMLLAGRKPAYKVVEELQRKIDELKNIKKELLAAAGYPLNYLEMEYFCPRCKDTGFVDNGTGSEKCVCYRQMVINFLYDQSGHKLIENENFSFFNEKYYSSGVDKIKYGIEVSPRENILAIKNSCLRFVDNFDSPAEKNLFFSGPTGTGKTFMANCVAMELINRGYTILYQTASMLFNTINEYRIRSFREMDYDDTDYKNIFEVELLIIDDLGTESPSDARYAELLTILNTRQINNLSKPCKTIISTNIGLKKLQEYYDERVISRIIGCFNIFRFAGEDIRGIKKLSSKQPV